MAVDIFNTPELKIGVTLNSVAPFYTNKTQSGKTIKRFNGLQYYEASVTVQYQAEHQYLLDEWLAVFKYGKPCAFPLAKSANTKYRGKQTATITSGTAAIAGAAQISINDFLEPGTKFTFANHTKVYEVREYNANNKLMIFYPALREPVQIGEILRYSNPVVMLSLNTPRVEQSLQQITGVELDFTEDLR